MRNANASQQICWLNKLVFESGQQTLLMIVRRFAWIILICGRIWGKQHIKLITKNKYMISISYSLAKQVKFLKDQNIIISWVCWPSQSFWFSLWSWKDDAHIPHSTIGHGHRSREHELLPVLGGTCDPVVGGYLGTDCPLELARDQNIKKLPIYTFLISKNYKLFTSNLLVGIYRAC